MRFERKNKKSSAGRFLPCGSGSGSGKIVIKPERFIFITITLTFIVTLKFMGSESSSSQRFLFFGNSNENYNNYHIIDELEEGEGAIFPIASWGYHHNHNHHDGNDDQSNDNNSNHRFIDTDTKELIQFVEQHGGYINPKQEYRYEDIYDPTNSIFGVFASADIERGEVLAYIPPSVIISPHKSDGNGNGEEKDYDHDEIPNYMLPKRFDNCDTVKLLNEELAKGESSSFYAPYIKALKKTSKEHSRVLPSYWSTRGKQLLLKLLLSTTTSTSTSNIESFGDTTRTSRTSTAASLLPPYDPFLFNLQWKHQCEPYSKEATLLVLTHGEDIGMVPLTDKYNSRGGNYTGAIFTRATPTFGLEIRAYRNLKRGEQIFTDYRDYGQIGTPELVRDYGFVELYPQRYIFPHQSIAFDILADKVNGNGETTKFIPLHNIFGKQYHNDPQALLSFGVHINKLKLFLYKDLRIARHEYHENQDRNDRDRDGDGGVNGITKHELDVLEDYCSDLIVAMTHAVNYAKQRMTMKKRRRKIFV